MQTDIRILNPNDAQQLKSLRLLGLQSDAYAFGSSFEEENQFDDSTFVERCTATDDKKPFGAFVNGQLVSMAVLVRETMRKARHHANVYSVFTHPDFRGQGISTRVMASLLESAKEMEGLEWLQLGVSTNNQAALAVYKKLGFETWGTMRAALRVDGEDIDEHMMSLKIL